jgi:hypothetical protein
MKYLQTAAALDLAERDLDEPRGALLVRRGKGGKRREVTARRGKLVALRQFTDSAGWLDALANTEYFEHSRGKEG